MSDVLIASSIEDRARVAPLVAGLRSAGLSVWWEDDLGGGENLQQKLTSELESARCVVTVWTRTSVGPYGELVQDVAARAKVRGILLPIRLDQVDAPLGFGQVRTRDLVQWNGKPRNRRFKQVVATIRAIVSGKPQPEASTRSLRRWLAGTAVALVLPLLSFFSDAHELLAPVCQIPGVHTACSRWGLGGVPTPEEEEAWTSRRPGDCSALREHLRRFPDGAYAPEAEHRLQASETETVERWQAEERTLPLTVRATAEPLPNEKAAQDDALVRSRGDADLVCAGYRSAGYRLQTATAKVMTWQCSPSRGGFVCGFDGQAVCQVETRIREQHEVCR